jgi:single-strand DNA-binding protein
MPSVSKTYLIGNLGADPELRYTGSGDAVCNFSVATTEQWKDKATGEKKERTEWHRVVAYRKLGEICGQHLKKGALVYVEGKNTTEKYTDKNGVDHYPTKVLISEMRMLGGRPEGASQGSAPSRPAGKPAGKPAEGTSAFDDFDDDLPF